MFERTKAVITGDGRVELATETVPELKDNEALIKVHASLISPGTEMNVVKQRRENPGKPEDGFAFGYANAGEIIEIKGDAKGLKPGMRVAAMGGGYALHSNYACVPVNLIVPIPDAVSYAQASYACLGATSLQAVRRTAPELGEYGLVLGLGIVGNLAAQLSQLSGAQILGWESMPSRAEIAKACGIREIVNYLETDAVAAAKAFAVPYGCDFAIFAFGGDGEAAYQSVLKCMKVSADGHQMGRIVLVGGCRVPVGGGAASGNVDIRASSRTGPGYHDPVWEYGADYPGAFIQFTTKRNLELIIRLIAERKLCVDPLTTHKLPLADAAKAADLLIGHPDKAMGIVLQMSH